jgi:hypothetical protein
MTYTEGDLFTGKGLQAHATIDGRQKIIFEDVAL